MSATVPAVSMAGDVLGMHTTEVKPPRAAAAVPLAMFSFAVCPGSRKCTCRSIKPGQTTRPLTSILSTPGGACFAASAPTAAILPSEIRTSAFASRRLAGSMTRPPVRSNAAMRGEGTRMTLTKQARGLSLAGLKRNRGGRSSMVERKPSKLHTWVRFPSPAPFIIKHLRSSAALAFFKIRKSPDVQIFPFVNGLEPWLQKQIFLRCG